MELFGEPFHYEIFLLLLRKALERYGGILHAYCLMTNHYHLLLETDQNEIWRIMKMLSQQYAMFYNRTNNYQGHLFEGRYKSCLVKDDTYFLQTSRYIHLNPVKAKMVAHPEDYRWSSYCTMIGLTDDRLTETNKTLAYFKSPDKMRYREFVEDIGHKYVVDEEMIRKEIRVLTVQDEQYPLKARSGNDIPVLLRLIKILMRRTRRIILTNGFVKKTQKTPKEEIQVAKDRRKDYILQSVRSVWIYRRNSN